MAKAVDSTGDQVAMDKVLPYAKAIVGFVAPAAAALIAATQEATPGGTTITTNEWLVAGLTAFVTASTVWAVPNKDPQAQHQDESVQPPA
jgi:hypothetical protein